MELAIKIILGIYFNSSNYISIIISCLYFVAAALMLKKSGSKWWIGFIPWYREYELARCANRESDGRVYAILMFVDALCRTLGDILKYFVPEEDFNAVLPIFVVLNVAVLLPFFIYNWRIFEGFRELYGSSKWWRLSYILVTPRFIAMYFWALNKNCQPKYKVDDLEKAMEKLTKFSSVAVMEQGLTVNLNERVAKGFLKSKKYLLKDIHLAIPAGHMVLLLGGSGAGKTTFLNAINGYEKADAEVILEGKNMYSEYKNMIYEIGFVPQQQMMRNKDTVIKTVRDYAELRLPKNFSKEERNKHADEVMDIFGLTPVKDNMVGTLSGGQIKRLSIAIEYLSNPSLFILDEPDSGLDGVMARDLFERLRKVADSGRIVIVITHSPDRVIDLFDDVIVLAKDSTRTGRLAYYGSVEDARKFFERDLMEDIVKRINQVEEGGDGLADDYILKYAEVAQHG